MPDKSKKTGKLIAIEGSDGSGKATQTELLANRLKREKFDVETVSFPQYGSKSAFFVEKYLKGNFADAFKTIVSTDYKSENESISIIACGAMVAEAMRAAYILKKEYDIETRVINMHTIKPIDKTIIINAVNDTDLILTVEEHQTGGFGNIVAGIGAQNKIGAEIYQIGVDDRFGQSGDPWELTYKFGLSAEHITKKVSKLLNLK